MGWLRGGGSQHLRCEISIQGRIRERLFYKDGQIELYRRSTLLEERMRIPKQERERNGMTEGKRASRPHMRSPLREGDIVVPNVTVAGCNEQCNGHVVKLLGRLNRRRRNPRATSPPLSSSAAARQLKGKGETKARGRLRTTVNGSRE